MGGNEDTEISSHIFIDEEKDGLIFQEDDIFCVDDESEGIRDVFIDEDNYMRFKFSYMKLKLSFEQIRYSRIVFHCSK